MAVHQGLATDECWAVDKKTRQKSLSVYKVRRPIKLNANVFPMRPQCVLNASPRRPQCVPNASPMRLQCVLNASSMRPQCILNASSMRPQCMPWKLRRQGAKVRQKKVNLKARGVETVRRDRSHFRLEFEICICARITQ